MSDMQELIVITDVFWCIILYHVVYKLVDLLLSEYASVFKILFDIEVRYYNYTRETATIQKHKLLHLISGCITFVILALNPVSHTVIFMMFRFVDVIQLNRILMYMALLRLLRDIQWFRYVDAGGDAYSRGAYVYQFVYTVINYTNVGMIAPTVFEICDNMFDIEYVLAEMSVAYAQLISSDSRALRLLGKIRALFVKHETEIVYARVGVLGFILVCCFIFSDLKTWGEVSFYYYALARVITLTRHVKYD